MEALLFSAAKFGHHTAHLPVFRPLTQLLSVEVQEGVIPIIPVPVHKDVPAPLFPTDLADADVPQRTTRQ